CTVYVPAQSGIGPIGYKNAQPAAGEVTLYAEVEHIATGIAGVCGTGKPGTFSEYREGEEVAGVALLAAKGKQADFQGKAKNGTTADAIEVGINEAHWYKN